MSNGTETPADLPILTSVAGNATADDRRERSAAANPGAESMPEKTGTSSPGRWLRKFSRRTLIGTGLVAAGVIGMGLPMGAKWKGRANFATLADKPLLSETVAFTSLSQRTLVHGAGDLMDGARVVTTSPAAPELATREAAWLASLAPWTREHEFADILSSAYKDIYVLTEGLAAPVAGWSRLWRYVWPRDSAHIAVASALAGDMDRALRCFDFLHALPRTSDGWFEARYDLNTLASPDDRAPQFDGLGWVGWSLGLIAAELDQASLRETIGWDRAAFTEHVRDLAVSAATSLIANVTTHQGVPVSADYWEIKEKHVTLGTAAVTLAGLNGLMGLFAETADDHLNSDLQACADLVVVQIVRDFDAYGYPRHAQKRALDSAIPFLLPPYNNSYPYQENVWQAVARAKDALHQPAGGLAPGEDWTQDGVSWTPETAIFAIADAYGPTKAHTEQARDTLQWLAQHRTAAGSYSEKILSDGTPVAVAPLAWTASCIAIATYGLTRGATD